VQRSINSHRRAAPQCVCHPAPLPVATCTQVSPVAHSNTPSTQQQLLLLFSPQMVVSTALPRPHRLLEKASCSSWQPLHSSCVQRIQASNPNPAHTTARYHFKRCRRRTPIWCRLLPDPSPLSSHGSRPDSSRQLPWRPCAHNSTHACHARLSRTSCCCQQACRHVLQTVWQGEEVRQGTTDTPLPPCRSTAAAAMHRSHQAEQGSERSLPTHPCSAPALLTHGPVRCCCCCRMKDTAHADSRSQLLTGGCHPTALIWPHCCPTRAAPVAGPSHGAFCSVHHTNHANPSP
jgi:hypothetical protein